jgi:hypothetical protein
MAGQGTTGGMGTRDKAPRVRCWERRRAGRDALTVRLQYPPRPPPHRGKDFLGAAMTVTIIGAILLFLTNGVAAHCAAAPDPRTGARACSGATAVVVHIREIMSLCVLACGALAVAAFIWYIFWGYKTNGQFGEDRGGDAGGPGGEYG